MNKSLLNHNSKSQQVNNLTLNFGPQHPAAHGVLRMVLTLDNEVITNNDIHIGLLHRGSEKLMEKKPYLHSLPYFDRFDYVSMLLQEHAYCISVEKLLNKKFLKKNVNRVRVMYDELTRILNHLLAIACHALDVGSMSPIFWGFEEREKIMEFYERVSGARMHAAFYRFGHNFLNSLPDTLIMDINYFVINNYNAINEINYLLVNNKIWKRRLVDVGFINQNMVKKYSVSGVLARSCGIKHDVRVNYQSSYSNYQYLHINSFTTKNGDCYDRYVLRIAEIYESLAIVNKMSYILSSSNNAPVTTFKNNKEKVYRSMEALIRHFKYWTEGVKPINNSAYSSVESAKGEFSVFIDSNGTNKPNRVRVRSPAFFHMQLASELSRGNLLADLVTLIGTLDIVFGEVDR